VGLAPCTKELASGLPAMHHTCRLSANQLSVSVLCIRKAACTVHGEEDTAAVLRSGAVSADGVNAGLTPNTFSEDCKQSSTAACHQRGVGSGQVPDSPRIL